MPELRRGVRRGRARLAPQNRQSELPLVQDYVKTRAAVAREAKRPRTRLETKRLKEKEEEDNKALAKNEEEANKVIVISEREEEEEESEEEEEEEESDFLDLERKKKREDLGVEEVKVGVMGDDSGGLSANKAAGQEEEGSTAPFPERVCVFFIIFFKRIF